MALGEWKRRRQIRKVARHMIAARREGRGLYLAEWQVPSAAVASGAVEAAIEPIVAWCRRTIAGCRRPHGIDHFDLALACAVRHGEPAHSAEFRDLRPPSLYADDGLGAQVAAFLQKLAPNTTAPSIRIAAALFSWGDAAHAALPSR